MPTDHPPQHDARVFLQHLIVGDPVTVTTTSGATYEGRPVSMTVSSAGDGIVGKVTLNGNDAQVVIQIAHIFSVE